jgi:hypothetical protein
MSAPGERVCRGRTLWMTMVGPAQPASSIASPLMETPGKDDAALVALTTRRRKTAHYLDGKSMR